MLKDEESIDSHRLLLTAEGVEVEAPSPPSEVTSQATDIVLKSLNRDVEGHESEGDSEDESENGSDNELPAATVWTVVTIISLGYFIANVDVTLVFASSQQVSSEFNALSSASWLVTSYSLAQCAMQPLYGKLSIIFGRKSNLVFCYFAFALGNIICAIGRTYWQVLVGRVIAGIGGAGMTALVAVIIADMVPVRKIAAWRSVVNVVGTVGRSLGGPIGGFLTDTVGWRWSFLGQAPLTLIGLALLLWKLPRYNASKTGQYQNRTLTQKLKRIDILGALALASTITCFLLTLDFMTRPSSWFVRIPFALSTVLTGSSFYTVEKHWAKEPVLPLELITRRVAWTSYLLLALQMIAQTSTFYALPIYFQIAGNASVADAGARMVPSVMGNATGGVIAGLIVTKTGRYKLVAICASISASIGYSLILLRWTGTTSWLETLYICFGGFGMGSIMSIAFVHLAAYFDQDEIAIAGTTYYLVHSASSLMGVQVATATLYASLRPILKNRLNDIEDSANVISQVISNINSIKSLPAAVHSVVTHAYIDSLRFIFGVSTFFALMGLLTGISIQEKRLR